MDLLCILLNYPNAADFGHGETFKCIPARQTGSGVVDCLAEKDNVHSDCSIKNQSDQPE